MKVLLLEDVKALGKTGEVVKASDGYARNYLIPKKFAVVATPEIMKKVERQKKLKAKKREEEVKKANEKLNDLMKKVLVIHAKAGKGDKLYGAITSANVSEKISEILDEKFNRKSIEMEPIRAIGLYDVKVKFGNGVTGKIKIKVEREELKKN